MDYVFDYFWINILVKVDKDLYWVLISYYVDDSFLFCFIRDSFVNLFFVKNIV